ncbi:Uncharacterised protein [uncultured archaeon]|nr:Uncharacterised protein [uncultured archaeon]
MTINQLLEDTGWGAIGTTPPTPEDAEEFLKLTDEDLAGIAQKYDNLLGKIIDDFYKI